RKEGHQCRGLHETAAKRVVDHNGTAPRGIDESGHAEKRIAAQLQRITEVIIQPPQNHIDWTQSAERLHEDAPVEHSEVCPFDEWESPLPRQERLFEVGFVMRAWRKDDDSWVGPLRRGQRK